MARSLRRFVLVLVVAIGLLGMFASTAMASLEDTPTPIPYLGSSATNPGAGADFWWRQGWGNSLYPQWTANPPGAWDEIADGYLLGMIYSMDGSQASVINTHTPDIYYRASFPVGTNPTGGTNMNNTFDLLGLYNDLALSSGALPQLSGAQVRHNPLEGLWYVHYVFYSNQRYSSMQWDQSSEGPVSFGIDLTPPGPVTNLTVSPGLSSPAYSPNAWAPTSRGYVKWTPAHDDLSGVGYYQVLIDDQPVIPEASQSPAQGRVYTSVVATEPISDAITIENLPAGRHKLSVQAVDRATNAGPETSVWYESDPDVPTIAWGSMMGDTLTTAAHTIAVDAADKAGNPFVSFSIDGSVVGTAAAPPYSITPDLSALTPGAHTLTATVTDMLGRQVTITKAVTWTPNGFVVLPPPPGGGSGTTTSTGGGGGSLEPTDTVTGVSSTNPDFPYSAGDLNSDRRGWGNSLTPDFTLAMPGGAEGFLYNVVTATSTIDPAHPDQYYRAAKPAGTNLANTIDLQGIYNYPPPGGWRPGPVAGSTNPIEGQWYLQLRYFDRSGHVSPSTYRIPFAIDITPPSAVTGLHIVPTLEPGAFGAVSASSRAHIAWNLGAYDALSGVNYYQVLVDGQPVIPSDGVVWDIASSIPNDVTIENLSPGHHVIGVYAVDRATNVGKPAFTDFYSDPDTPTVSIASPSGTLIGVKPKVQVTVGDLGGVKSVSYALDGVAVGSSATAPYSATVDLSSFTGGTHTLSASVTDMMGRTATASKSVNLDKTALTLSGLKVSGTGRKVAVSFSVSKPASVSLYVPRTKYGKTLSAGKAGRYSFTYTYPKGAKYPSPLSFKDSFTLSASDSLGNTTSVGSKWTVHVARLVRVSASKIKVVYY